MKTSWLNWFKFLIKSKDDFDIELPQFSPFELVLAEARYIMIYDEIEPILTREINTKIIAMSIKNVKKPIFIEINSPGGSVSCGVAIMNTIQTSPSPIITLINGEACSMAGLISVVADYRFICPNSYWMGHPMQDIVGGTPQTIKDRGNYLDKLETDLTTVFKNKTKLNEEEFQKMLRGELWLNAEECLAKGIVDEIKPILRPPVKTKETKKSKKAKSK
jgi:ATP-dependent Clp protease protease subunit